MNELSPKKKLLNMVLICCAAVLIVGVIFYFINRGKAAGREVRVEDFLPRYETAMVDNDVKYDTTALYSPGSDGQSEAAVGDGPVVFKLSQSKNGLLKSGTLQWKIGEITREQITPHCKALFFAADTEMTEQDFSAIMTALYEGETTDTDDGGKTSNYNLHNLQFTRYVGENYEAILVADVAGFKDDE